MMKKFVSPLMLVAALAYACGGETTNQVDPEEAFYKECLENMEATHDDTYTAEVRDEYCKCAASTYMATFSANDRSLMGYGMSNEQTAEYEAALTPCREQLENSVIVEPEVDIDSTD